MGPSRCRHPLTTRMLLMCARLLQTTVLARSECNYVSHVKMFDCRHQAPLGGHANAVGRECLADTNDALLVVDFQNAKHCVFLWIHSFFYSFVHLFIHSFIRSRSSLSHRQSTSCTRSR
jgi:hypothetical protein